jgi:riboflavin synthase
MFESSAARPARRSHTRSPFDVFTGLVQEVGTVASVTSTDGGARIRLSAPLAAGVETGDSVLVNGVCLTATNVNAGAFEADLSPETLSRSALGALAPGDRVNLELPLRASDRLGGHIVQGHVDAVAEVREVHEHGGGRDLRVEAPQAVLRYVVEKGSVALDGVSLTVTEVDENGFGVSLIPETLARTNLADVAPARKLNVEVDVLAKYVEKLVGPGRTGNSGGVT